jgi:hypothetical protein
MDERTEQVLTALLAKEGLEPRPGDLEAFAEIIELYLGNLETLRGLDLGDEEIAPVFHPEWTGR